MQKFPRLDATGSVVCVKDSRLKATACSVADLHQSERRVLSTFIDKALANPLSSGSRSVFSATQPDSRHMNHALHFHRSFPQPLCTTPFQRTTPRPISPAHFLPA
jgi:hypothetical protein